MPGRSSTMYLKHNFPFKLKKAVINKTHYSEIYYCYLRIDLVKAIFSKSLSECDDENLRVVLVSAGDDCFALKYSGGTSSFE